MVKIKKKKRKKKNRISIITKLLANYYILLQMQCDGHGHFLEITQVIRRLELTIVKGVMENRSDSTWAHFVIEVQHVSKSESLPYMHRKIVH